MTLSTEEKESLTFELYLRAARFLSAMPCPECGSPMVEDHEHTVVSESGDGGKLCCCDCYFATHMRLRSRTPGDGHVARKKHSVAGWCKRMALEEHIA